jgi:hypothetical protein
MEIWRHRDTDRLTDGLWIVDRLIDRQIAKQMIDG